MTHSSPEFFLEGTRRSARRRGGPSALARFRRSEDGAVVMFTLFVLLMMLIAGGVAIDVMRHEMERARLQNALDTAVLAGAGAPYGTTPTPKAIVQDYMAKAGMAEYLAEIDDDGEGEDDIVHTLNMSKVTATASKSMDTYLMQLSGVKQLGAVAVSSAERRVPKLEVAMVLDVSGSMGEWSSTTDASGRWVSKMTHLKKAAKEFVTTILNSTKTGNASISIVPFSWDVTPGPYIFDALSVDERQNYSSCLRFSDNDFNSAAIDPAVQQTQLIYTARDHYGFDSFRDNTRTCYTNDYAEILPYQINESALHNKIDALKDSGNTSGDMGMKWGTALMDPSFQSVKTELGAVVARETPEMVDGVQTTVKTMLVDSRVGVVPAAYDEGDTLKVIVMMGDGQNTYSYQFPIDSKFRGPGSYLHRVTWDVMEFDYAFRNNKKSGISYDEGKCDQKNWECVYKVGGTESVFYLYDPTDNEYINLSTDQRISVGDFANLNEDLLGFISSEQLTWEEAWGVMTPRYLGEKTGYWTAWNEFNSDSNRVSGGDKDRRMSSVCTAAKNKGIIVYTIGFEIDKGGNAEVQLKNCATSDLHYFPAKGISISDAFASIASDVVNLRLTQ